LGYEVTPDNVIFMPGSHTALYFVCYAVLNPGDELLVPEPYYAAYEAIFASTGATVVPLPLDPADGFHLQMDVVEQSTTTSARAMILNNPHNPTGAVLAPERVDAITQFCVERDIWLISDEVYEDLVYEGVFRSPLANRAAVDHVVAISSVSKSHAMTGWRCGWAVGPSELISRVRDVAEAMMFGAQPFLQDATAYALGRHFDECDSMYNDYLRRARLVERIFAGRPAMGVRVPQAGIFVMVDIRTTGLSGVEFASQLLDEWDVATMPGESFGPSARGHLRLSLTTDDASIETGCARILEFVDSLR
jgi:arginine:pyruvate transaminase